MNAMLLCAGLGTRFRPHTEKLAKPAIPFLGVPLAGWPLFYTEGLSPETLVINTHHLPKTVESAVSCFTHQSDYQVKYINEAPAILGSGGGIANAKDHLLSGDDDVFLVANGDEVMIAEDASLFRRLIEAHRKNNALATLLLTEHPEAGKSMGAVIIDKNEAVQELGVRTAGPNSKHFCGVFVFSKRIFDFMPNSKKDFHIFHDCLTPAMQRGEKVMGFLEKDLLWLDMSDEKHYIQATNEVLKILTGPTTSKKKTLEQVLQRFHQKFTLDSGRHVWLGKDAILGPNADVKGFGVLCAGAHFEQGILENAVVAPNLHVHEMVALRNQLLV